MVCEVATGCRDKQAAQSVLDELMRRAELVKAKVLSPDQDRIADHAGTPIAEHIEAFLDYQRRKGTHIDRVKHYETKLYETADACKFRTLCDLSVDRLDGMARLNEQAERRRRARAMTENELSRLLDAARRRPLEHAMTVYRGANKGKLLAKVSGDRQLELERLGTERARIDASDSVGFGRRTAGMDCRQGTWRPGVRCPCGFAADYESRFESGWHPQKGR